MPSNECREDLLQGSGPQDGLNIWVVVKIRNPKP